MTDFLDEQYRISPPVPFPELDTGIPRVTLPPAGVPAQAPAPVKGQAVIPVFDTRPLNAQDVYFEYVNAINFAVPAGFTFILRKVSANGFADSAMTKPVLFETGLRLNVTINGINTVLSDPNFGFASSFDAPVFVTLLERSVLGGGVTANKAFLAGPFNQWTLTVPQPPAGFNWGRSAASPSASITIGQGSTEGIITLDGIHLTAFTFPVSVGDIAYFGGVWMAASWATEAVVVSFDGGATWATYTTLPGVASPNAIAGGTPGFVVYNNGRIYLTVNTGQSWNAGTVLAGMSGFVQRIIWDGAQFIARTNGGATLQVYSSPDGITWTLKFSVAFVSGGTTIEFGNGVYLAEFNSAIYRSTDLVNWTNVLGVALGLPQYGSGLKFNNGVWRTVALAGNVDYTSADNGLTWQSEFNPLGAGGSMGVIADTFYELQAATGVDLTMQNAAQAAQGGLTMKFSIEGQMIPNNAMPAELATKG